VAAVSRGRKLEASIPPEHSAISSGVPRPAFNVAEGLALFKGLLNDKEALAAVRVAFDPEESWVRLKQLRVERVEDGRRRGHCCGV
jgi:hypothetical protein